MRARLAALPLLLAALPCLAGGDEGGFEVRVPELVQVEALSDDAAGKAFAILGPAAVRVEGVFSLRARRLVVWLDPDFDRQVFTLVEELKAQPGAVPLWAVRAVYAEGGRTPAVFQTAGQAFRCSRLYYDLTVHRGLLLDAELRLRRTADNGEELPDLLLRAKTFRATGPGEWAGEDVTLASTDYHRPQVALHVERLRLTDREAKEAVGKLVRISARGEGPGPERAEVDAVLQELDAAMRSRQGRRLELEGIRAKARGVPLFGWKRLALDGDETPPLRLEADLGGKGSLGSGGRLGVGMGTEPVGWMFGAGYYGDRHAPLFDLEVETRTERFSGRSFGVLLHDDDGTDRGVVPSTKERYWHQHQYRWLASDRWRLDGEFADLSDATWLRAYAEGEFKEGKEQESLLYLRRRGAWSYATLTGKGRSIGFQETLEELPRFVWSVPVVDLFELGRATVQLSGALEIANLRLRRGDGDPLPDQRSARVDASPTVTAALDAGPVRVVPFARFRLTGYEDSVSGEDLGRFAGSAGVRLDTQLERWFGPVRHVVDLSLEYEDLYTVSESAGSLFQFDAVDAVAPFEQVLFRWRNRFQRRSERGRREFLNVELLVAWFPDGRRPLGARGDGFAELYTEWRPTDRTLVEGRLQVDTETGRVDTGSLESWWQVRENVFLFTGLRHLEGDSDIATASMEIEVDTRWRLVLSSQYDVKNEDSLDQEIRIQRLGQTAVFGLRLSWDPGDDDFSVGFKLDLLERFRKKRRRDRLEDRRLIGWR